MLDRDETNLRAGKRHWFGGYSGGELYLALHPNDVLDIIDGAVDYPFHSRWTWTGRFGNKVYGRVYCDGTFRIQSKWCRVLCLVGRMDRIPGGSRMSVEIERDWWTLISVLVVPLVLLFLFGLIAAFASGRPAAVFGGITLLTIWLCFAVYVPLSIQGLFVRDRLVRFLENLFGRWEIPPDLATADPPSSSTDIRLPRHSPAP